MAAVQPSTATASLVSASFRSPPDYRYAGAPVVIPSTASMATNGLLACSAVPVVAAATASMQRRRRCMKEARMRAAADAEVLQPVNLEVHQPADLEAAEQPSNMTAVAGSAASLSGQKAIPFLPEPTYRRFVRNVPGDMGFDPLGLAGADRDTFVTMYESELKHGRIAMLATLGYITVDLGIILHPLGQGLTSATAHDVMVENGNMGFPLLLIAIFELTSYISVSEMLQGSGREAGDFGFGYTYIKNKTDEEIALLKYQEIMNGRLAMMAFGGMVTQSVLFEKGFPYY